MKKIDDYNLHYKHGKGLVFKLLDGKIYHETRSTEQIVAFIEKNGKISEFSFSDSCSLDNIDFMLNLCLNNLSSKSKISEGINYNKSQEAKKIYNEFSYKKYINWLQSELNLLKKNLSFKFNFVYSLDILKIDVISDKNFREFYESLSECVCVNSEFFKQNASLSNYFLYRDLSRHLLIKLKEFNFRL